MTLFDCLKDIITLKSGGLNNSPDFKKAFNVFMICRYLSMDKRFSAVAAEANRLQESLTQEQMYQYLLASVPRHRNSYIRYISKKKKDS